MRFLEGLLPVAALLGLVAALAQTTPAMGTSVTYTFKGVLLDDLILATRSADAEVRNTSLSFGWYVLAQEADGYEVSLGESAPGLGNRSVLLAYEQHAPVARCRRSGATGGARRPQLREQSGAPDGAAGPPGSVVHRRMTGWTLNFLHPPAGPA